MIRISKLSTSPTKNNFLLGDTEQYSCQKSKFLLIELRRNKKRARYPIPYSFLPEYNLIQKLTSELLHSNRLIKVHYDDVKSRSEGIQLP